MNVKIFIKGEGKGQFRRKDLHKQRCGGFRGYGTLGERPQAVYYRTGARRVRMERESAKDWKDFVAPGNSRKEELGVLE